jgi:hypothetical protein
MRGSSRRAPRSAWSTDAAADADAVALAAARFELREMFPASPLPVESEGGAVLSACGMVQRECEGVETGARLDRKRPPGLTQARAWPSTHLPRIYAQLRRRSLGTLSTPW